MEISRQVEMRCPEVAGRFQININVLIVLLKVTETEISVEETGRERFSKWKCERGPREAGRARSGGTKFKPLPPQTDPIRDFGGLPRLSAHCQGSGLLRWYHPW